MPTHQLRLLHKNKTYSGIQHMKFGDKWVVKNGFRKRNLQWKIPFVNQAVQIIGKSQQYLNEDSIR